MHRTDISTCNMYIYFYMINHVWEATWAATELKNARLAVLSLVWREDRVLLRVAKCRAAGTTADPESDALWNCMTR